MSLSAVAPRRSAASMPDEMASRTRLSAAASAARSAASPAPCSGSGISKASSRTTRRWPGPARRPRRRDIRRPVRGPQPRHGGMAGLAAGLQRLDHVGQRRVGVMAAGDDCDAVVLRHAQAHQRYHAAALARLPANSMNTSASRRLAACCTSADAARAGRLVAHCGLAAALRPPADSRGRRPREPPGSGSANGRFEQAFGTAGKTELLGIGDDHHGLQRRRRRATASRSTSISGWQPSPCRRRPPADGSRGPPA
ncbi:Uncharacterised protein [Chromobacterium violaceum]|uniref:Uncharacterized protein n=1 Tax=Chromobacterium violaceum TaxID=536 RepID=A0A3S4IWU0_CHRVL|nr:Uncharacterised protein [Chromobacterium violaceum]